MKSWDWCPNCGGLTYLPLPVDKCVNRTCAYEGEKHRAEQAERDKVKEPVSERK